MPVQEFLMTSRNHLLCTNIVQRLQQQKGEKSFIALLPSLSEAQYNMQHQCHMLSSVQKYHKMFDLFHYIAPTVKP